MSAKLNALIIAYAFGIVNVKIYEIQRKKEHFISENTRLLL